MKLIKLAIATGLLSAHLFAQDTLSTYLSSLPPVNMSPAAQSADLAAFTELFGGSSSCVTVGNSINCVTPAPKTATPMAIPSCPVPGFCNGIYPTKPIASSPLPFSGQFASVPKGWKVSILSGGKGRIIVSRFPIVKLSMESKPKGKKGK